MLPVCGDSALSPTLSEHAVDPDLDGSNKPGMKQIGGLTLRSAALAARRGQLHFEATQRPANGEAQPG